MAASRARRLPAGERRQRRRPAQHSGRRRAPWTARSLLALHSLARWPRSPRPPLAAPQEPPWWRWPALSPGCWGGLWGRAWPRTALPARTPWCWSCSSGQRAPTASACEARRRRRHRLPPPAAAAPQPLPPALIRIALCTLAAVCDDGLPLPDAADALERCAAALAVGSLLAAPLFLDSMLLVQTTGARCELPALIQHRSADAGGSPVQSAC